MSKIIHLDVCTEFCSLLLSKPLVLLDIPELKKVLELCASRSRSCCASSKDKLGSLMEKEAHDIISSLGSNKIAKLKISLIDKKENSNINIKFNKISKNITI